MYTDFSSSSNLAISAPSAILRDETVEDSSSSLMSLKKTQELRNMFFVKDTYIFLFYYLPKTD